MDRVTRITYPDAASVSLTYNNQTLLESVEGVIDDLDYNARNQITSKELSNGVVTNYTYDTEKLLLDRIYTESLQDLNYEFDNVGNILEIEDDVLDSLKTYGYDDLDRLINADMVVNSTLSFHRDYSYDRYGCIQTVTDRSNQSYYYRMVNISGTVVGEDVIVQINDSLASGMEADYSNVEFRDLEGHLLTHDRSFDGENDTVRIKCDTTDGSTSIYQYWGSYISATEASKLFDESALPYYLSSTTEGFIKTNVTASGTKTLYVEKKTGYSPEADNVFDLFDDFNSRNTSKWTFNDPAYPTMVNSIATWENVPDSGNGVQSILIFGDNYTFESYSKIPVSNKGINTIGFHNLDGDIAVFTARDDGDTLRTDNRNDGSSTHYAEGNSYESDYHVYKVEKTSDAVYYSIDGTLIRTITSNVPDENMAVVLSANKQTYYNNGYLYIDWVLVRKYTPTEPAVTITDIGDGVYKMDITSATDLTDYQVPVNFTNLSLASTTESLYITEKYLETSLATFGSVQSIEGDGPETYSYGYNMTPFHAPLSYNGNDLDYDANGNLIEDENFTYTYNDVNQLSEVRYVGNGSLVERYWYDANGQRMKKQNVAGEFTYYINKFYEIENGTATSYFFRDDERVAKETSGSVEWYLLDHLGSTSLLVDTNGSVVERSEYFPYGAIESGGSEKYGFTGQENDADTGLMYYGARYYSPGYRVFVQPDTMLPDPYDPQALNRYSYCLNNPLRYTDPSGHIIDVALDLGFIGMDVVDIYNDPSDTWAWAALGADVVCAVIPVATGGGLGVKALKKGLKGDDLMDSGKFVDDAVDTTDSLIQLNHRYKHVANKNIPWKNIVKGTKHGDAKYIQNLNTKDIEKLERKVWDNGVKIEQNGKTVSIMEFDDVIGASSGKETNYVMVEMSGDFIHGRPIDATTYKKLLKKSSEK